MADTNELPKPVVKLTAPQRKLWDRIVGSDIYGEISFSKMATVLDVGGHLGAFAAWAAAKGAQRVVSYEPHPDRFREVVANTAPFSGVEVRHGMVSLRTGNVRPHIDDPCEATRVVNVGKANVPCTALADVLREFESVELLHLNVGADLFELLRQPGILANVTGIVGDYAGANRKVVSLEAYLRDQGFTTRAYTDAPSRGKLFAFKHF